MTEICSASRRVDPEGVTRLTAALTQAFTVGMALDPLGPRSSGLHSLGLSLDTLAETLRAELAVLDASLADVGADPCGEHWLSRILAEVERLALLAHLEPAAEAGDASAA